MIDFKEGKQYKISDIINGGLEVIDNNESPKEYIQKYGAWILNMNEEVSTMDEAMKIAKENIKYWTKFCDRETESKLKKFYE